MTNAVTHPPLAPIVAKVLTALADLGEATAAAIADHAGIGYSTTTPKLRTLEDAALAERFRVESRTLWRITDAGRTAIKTSPGGDTPADPTSDEPALTEPPAVATGDAAGDVASANPDSTDDTTSPAASPNGPVAAGDVSPPPSNDVEPTSNEEPDSAGAAEPSGTAGQTRRRRAGGSLRGAVLDVLEAHPDRQYKTGELCRLVDAGNAGSGAAKASAGAAANALSKLIVAGKVVQTVERPATYQLAPTSSDQ
jgi:hypothetical protein